jgi:hypothetical protein
MTDLLLTWLVAEDDGAKQKIASLLSDRDEDLSNLAATLEGENLDICGLF